MHSTFFRQVKEGKQRLLVHLYNDVNTTAFHGLPNDDVPLREETIPIHDIQLNLHGYKLKSATQQPEAKRLKIEQQGHEATIVIPRLEVHSIVVLELEA